MSLDLAASHCDAQNYFMFHQFLSGITVTWNVRIALPELFSLPVVSLKPCNSVAWLNTTVCPHTCPCLCAHARKLVEYVCVHINQIIFPFFSCLELVWLLRRCLHFPTAGDSTHGHVCGHDGNLCIFQPDSVTVNCERHSLMPILQQRTPKSGWHAPGTPCTSAKLPLTVSNASHWVFNISPVSLTSYVGQGERWYWKKEWIIF